MIWALAMILLISLAKFWEIGMVATPLSQVWEILMRLGRKPEQKAEDEATEE
jgi:hypothetical protein